MNELAEVTSGEELLLGPLENSLGFLLRLSQLTAFDDFFEHFKNAGIRPGELSVLLLIDQNPGVRQGVLARRLMIKRAHMTKMIQAFEADGLVVKSTPEKDRRGIELCLTDKGRQKVGRMVPTFQRHERSAHRSLTQWEHAELKRLLLKYLELPVQP